MDDSADPLYATDHADFKARVAALGLGADTHSGPDFKAIMREAERRGCMLQDELGAQFGSDGMGVSDGFAVTIAIAQGIAQSVRTIAPLLRSAELLSERKLATSIEALTAAPAKGDAPPQPPHTP